jgi:hypothetical protein
MKNRSKYYLKGEMRQRGWNQAMLDEFGLEPDKYEANPRFKRAYPTQYYLKSKVHAVEGTLEFQQRLAKKREVGTKLSEAMKRAKIEKRLEHVNNFITGDFTPGTLRSHLQGYFWKKYGQSPITEIDL